MLKTPPGVAWPFEPVLTLARPMRMPLRYTCMVCSGTPHQHHERTARRELRLPRIFTRFERSGRVTGWRAFGVRRRFFHRLCGGEQGERNSKDRKEFHE